MQLKIIEAAYIRWNAIEKKAAAMQKKSPIHLPESPINLQQSPVHLQKSPINPPKKGIESHRPAYIVAIQEWNTRVAIQELAPTVQQIRKHLQHSPVTNIRKKTP